MSSRALLNRSIIVVFAGSDRETLGKQKKMNLQQKRVSLRPELHGQQKRAPLRPELHGQQKNVEAP